jgi:hypothetical protein
MQWLKQSTAVTLKIGPYVDEDDGKTAETGLTLSQADIRLSKNGGNMAQKNEASACTHDEIGVYDCPVDTTDTNTLGRLQLFSHESGALPVWHEYMVVPANVWDAFFGTDKLQVDAVEVSSDATAADDLELLVENSKGTDNKVLLSADAQDLSASLDVNTKLIEGSDPTDQIRDSVVDDATRIDASALNTHSAITAAAIADAVWDEVLTGATHNVATSAGRRLRELGAFSVVSGTATAGAAQTITLDANASATANIYNQNLIVIIGGTGAGQARMIIEYTTGRVATVDRTWEVNPASGSEYQIVAFSGILLANHGVAQAGAASTITLATSALAVANSYIGCAIYIAAGTGDGQTRLITAYTAGRVATVSPAWDTQPDNTSAYKVLPVGRSIVESLPTATQASIDAIEASTNELQTDWADGGRLDLLLDAASTGAGAITFTYTLTSDADGSAITDASVWVTSDEAGTSVLASGTTDSNGQVTFYLDAGTVYVWRQKAGFNFSNPDTETVA